MSYKIILCCWKITSYARLKWVILEEAISLAINKKECTPIAVKVGKEYKSSVNIIVTVSEAKNHQNYTPQIMVSEVTTQNFPHSPKTL
jgi:hypothetical protein